MYRLAALLIFFVGLGPSADGQTSTQNSTVSIVYDESSLSDRDLAALIDIFALEHISKWRTENITTADLGQVRFIENHYNLTSLTNPAATEALIKLISLTNPGKFKAKVLIPGTPLKIPPVPRRVYRTNHSPKTPLRFFSIQGLGAVATTGVEGAGDIAHQPLLEDVRDATLTALQISNISSLIKKAWSSTEPVLPIGAHAFDPNGDVNLEVHNSSRACDSTQDWLAYSPLLMQLKERIAQVLSNPELKQRLLQDARSSPLVIIDWISPPLNHGKKVASVARGVLSQLGLKELEVTEVDLNPANNRQVLTDIFEHFVKNEYCSSQNCEGSKGIIDESRKWLKTNPGTANNTIPVKQLVLEAVLWKYFKEQTAWVNMSFSINSPALEILQASFFSNSRSFGFSSANDAGWPESSAGIPQRAATLYTNFANVTYGNSNGTLIGGYSNSIQNMIVSLVGPGCGFNFDAITPSDEGTSFATPYVAVGAWIKFLLDKISPSDMRKQLISASFLSTAPAGIQVESGGLFDLPALITSPRFLLFDNKESATVLSRGMLTIWYKTPAVDGVQLEASRPFQAGEGVSISFVRKGGGLVARIRSFRSGSPLPPLTDTVEWDVTRATLMATDNLGRQIDGTEADLETKYTRIIF